MAVPTLITDLSTTPASNSPAGSENVFPNLDDYLRAQSAFLASVRDNSGNGWVSPYLPLAGGTMTGSVSNFTAATGTFSGNVQMASANGGQLAGLRNKIINGNMLVNQRGGPFTLTANGTYTVDRWIAVTSVAPSGTLTLTKTNVAITEGTSSNACIRLSKTSGTYAASLVAGQAFESSNSWEMAGKTVTISFKVRKGSSYTGNALPYLAVITGTGIDQSATSMLAGTWTGSAVNATTLTGTLTTSMSVFSATTTIPASATQIGLQIGSTYATATTGSANDYLDITDVQLEVGPVATPFEQRSIALETLLAQRYYYRLTPGAVNRTFSTAPCVVASAVSANGSTQFPVSMRTTPATLDQSGTFNQYTVLSVANTTCTAVPILNANLTTTEFGGVTFTTTGATAGLGTLRTDATNGATAFLGWSAEL